MHLSCPATAEDAERDFLRPLPWILEMSVAPSRDLRDRSCEHCGDLNPLGSMCCGMCAFWVCDPTPLVPRQDVQCAQGRSLSGWLCFGKGWGRDGQHPQGVKNDMCQYPHTP